MIITSEDIITQARSWLGTRFHHQGRLKKTTNTAGGVDCIGLVIGVIAELGLYDAEGQKPLSHYDRTDYSMLPDGKRLKAAIEEHFDSIPITNIAPADMLLFRFQDNPQHVGFVSDYVQGGLGLIHCHARSKKVVEHGLTDVWRNMTVAAYRFKKEHLTHE